jgi:hypothetical protein
LEVELVAARRRPRLTKSVDSVMQFVEAEMARLLAADPAVEAARQRAVRRAGHATPRRSSRELTPAH